MSDTPSVCGMIPTRSSGILMDYVLSHEPCAPGASTHIRMFDECSVLSTRNPCRGAASSAISESFPYSSSGCGGCRDVRTGPGASYAYPMLHAGIPEDDEEYSRYDRVEDWLACAGAGVIIACVLGLVQSYAVFAPAIQHHYQTGFIETTLVGCLCYFVLVIFLPAADAINRALKHRWTAIFGMLLFFCGLLLDALTLHESLLYVTHTVFMGIGGSLAYASAMSICSDRFRKKLCLALCVLTCAGPVGTIIFYLLSNLMLDNVSYMWCKLCLALIVLICMGACQTFPPRSSYVSCNGRGGQYDKSGVKKCLKDYAAKKDCGKGHDIPRKSILCVCICDVSVLTDYSFLLWAVLNLIATSTIFIPYICLVAVAMEMGVDSALGLICYFCLASIATRFLMMHSNDHTFGFNRIMFQVCCFGSGIMYILLNWVETYGWVTVWGIVAGALEGILCVVVPRLTVQTVPMKWLGTSWIFVVIFHAFGIPIGPVVTMSVYRNTLTGGPGWIALAVAQIIAGILAFLLPNEMAAEAEVEAVGVPRGRTADCTSGIASLPSYGSGGGSLLPTNFSTFSGPSFSENGDQLYTKNCPICSKVGCIPGCCSDCVPGGLTSSGFSGVSPCGGGLSSSYYGSLQRSPTSFSPNYPTSYIRSSLPSGCRDFVGEINNYLDQMNSKTTRSLENGKGRTGHTSSKDSKGSNRKDTSGSAPKSSADSKPTKRPDNSTEEPKQNMASTKDKNKAQKSPVSFKEEEKKGKDRSLQENTGTTKKGK